MTLEEWLIANHIKFELHDRDLCSIPGFGECLVQPLDKWNDELFKVDEEGCVSFNCIDSIEGLRGDGIRYVIVQFGNLWYYIDIERDFKLEILKYVGEYSGVADDGFANLGVHDGFELLNGSSLPKSWVRKAKWIGQKAIGVCNFNTMASLYNLQCECKSADLVPVFGYSLRCRVNSESTFDAKVLVQTQQGLQNLLRIQKAIMVDNAEEGEIAMEELKARGKGNVLVFGKFSPLDIDLEEEWVKELAKSFDRAYYQLDLNEYKADRIDTRLLEAFRTWYNGSSCIDPILIPDCYYLDGDDAKNKIILNKVASGAAHEQSDQQYLKTLGQLKEEAEGLFSFMEDCEGLFRVAVKNVTAVVEGAKARWEDKRNFMPKYDLTEKEKEKYGNAHNMFSQLLLEGLERLAPKDRYEEYRQRMEREKYVIESTDNVDYLLVQYDSTNWCRENGIYVGCGRGSAAGSLLLYLLGITLVDPMKYDLLFERFLLPERAGLYEAQTTLIKGQISSSDYVEIELENGRTVLFDRDAKFLVKREGMEQPIEIYADELQASDDIILDNRDKIFTINEI